MSNPYDCSVCHNEGYDHAPDCPYHPVNLLAQVAAEEEAHADDSRPHWRNRIRGDG